MLKLLEKNQRINDLDFSFNLLTLAFQDKAIENRFNTLYFKKNLQLGRACHLMAIFFYAVVGLWNAIVVDPSRLHIWVWLICVVAIVFSVGLSASYFALPLYAARWKPMFAFYVFITGTGITVVTITASSHYLVYNFIGIIFCLFFCYAFIRLTFLWASIAGNFVVALYITGVVVFLESSFRQLAIIFFYILGINLLGMIVCYSLELMSRRDFMLNTLLRQAEDEARHLNATLEKKVLERTAELDTMNQELNLTLQREKELVAKLENNEQNLQKSIDSLEQAEHIAKLGYFERNWKTGETYWSKGFFKLLGYDRVPNELTYDQFIECIHKDDKEKAIDQIQGTVDVKNGSSMEFRLHRKSGRVIQVQGITDTVYKENNPSITKGIFQDITERKQAQASLKQMGNQLIQAQKMESVGRLAGGVAHDYNNISSIIIGYTELSMGDVTPEDPIYSNLEEILSAANRATDITRQLLAFARKQTIMPIVIDLNKTVDSMLKILRRLIGEDIQLTWLPGTQVWSVKIDPSQVDQILANLCVNARDAISNTGKITIETANVVIDENYCDDHFGFVSGKFAMLAVSDDGKGMSPDIMENIFEPFFTTKGIGQGTGLGLATVYGIVKQNQGFINVYSEVNKGTTIKVYLPKNTEAAAKKSKAAQVCNSSKKGENILFVEDDVSILKFGKKMLNSLGYNVLAANTPNEAVEVAKKQNQDIHLLITDVIMPEMNGRQLANEFQAMFPKIQILFMSGYTANVISHHGVLEKGVHFLAKPFTKNALALKIRDILDGT